MKLGLIAMSGLRARNADLNALGLTLPGFVERNKVIGSLPSLGLLTLAGLTPADVSLEYREVRDLSELSGVPGEYDAVAISSYTAQIRDAYRLADRYRSVGTKVILGGPHVTALPHEATRHADAILLGEGEVLWPTAMADLLRTGLRPVYDARSYSFNLGSAPMPRFELLDPDRYNRITVQTQRGCPFDCEFCAASLRMSPKFKVKPVEKVLAEVRVIKSIWERPFIEFADDNTFVNRSHGKRLMRALAEENIRWFTETDVSVAEDEELLSLMRDSGCAQVLIGFESPVREGLDGLERKSNWKAEQFDKYQSLIDRVQRHGIAVNGCFVLGLDGTDITSFQKVAEFVKDSGLRDVQVTLQTPFPGTPLYRRLKREKRLLCDDAWDCCTLFDVNFQPSDMTVTELERGFHRLVRELYNETATRERRSRFRRCARTGPRHSSAARSYQALFGRSQAFNSR